ncbi:MAG: hypothetical protein H6550_09555 [Chitinophagales bacterium]|nr:hypothetical protein [Chitinophagales bacterium]
MKHLLYIALLLCCHTVTAQDISRAFVYEHSSKNQNDTMPVKLVEFNAHNQPILEIEYCTKAVDIDQFVPDTTCLEHKRQYYYQDTLLKMTVDYQLKHNSGGMMDTIVTHFDYDHMGLLHKKWNSRATQTFYYNKNKQISSDSIYGGEWDNSMFEAKISIASYTYFNNGYTIQRKFNDDTSSRIDSIFHVDNQWVKHVEVCSTYCSDICAHGMVVITSCYETKSNYLSDGRLSSIVYHYPKEDDYFDEYFKKEEYVYDK